MRRVTTEPLRGTYVVFIGSGGRIMGPVFYIMAILGCGDGAAACQQVRMVDTHYASADACAAAMNAALMDATDLSFPEVTAECRPSAKANLAAAQAKPRG